MIRAIIFDFDGVILESADIKTRAFRRLFEDHPDWADKIVSYHEENMGISRFVKFEYIYRNFFKQELTPNKQAELGARFSELVLDEVLKTPFVPGALEFLKRNAGKYLFFVASGTPEEELLLIAGTRGVTDHFRKIFGAPADKREIVRNIMNSFALQPFEIVFVGDAESDRRAAEDTGVHFIARVTEGGSLNSCSHKIKDLVGLENKLKELEEVTT